MQGVSSARRLPNYFPDGHENQIIQLVRNNQNQSIKGFAETWLDLPILGPCKSPTYSNNFYFPYNMKVLQLPDSSYDTYTLYS